MKKIFLLFLICLFIGCCTETYNRDKCRKLKIEVIDEMHAPIPIYIEKVDGERSAVFVGMTDEQGLCYTWYVDGLLVSEDDYFEFVYNEWQENKIYRVDLVVFTRERAGSTSYLYER